MNESGVPRRRAEAGIGGTVPIYSASFNMTASVQDYDLQSIISSSATLSDSPFFGKVEDKRVTIRRVFFKTPGVDTKSCGFSFECFNDKTDGNTKSCVFS